MIRIRILVVLTLVGCKTPPVVAPTPDPDAGIMGPCRAVGHEVCCTPDAIKMMIGNADGGR